MKIRFFVRFLPALFPGLLLLAAPDACADERGGFAGQRDVVGYWKLIPWSPELAAKNLSNPWPLPYQYFAFYENGQMFSHMSTHSTDHTHGSLDRLHGMIPHTVRYRFDQGFMVVTREDQPGQDERWGVNLIAQDFSSGGTDFKTGDLVMSLDDGQGNVVYRRLLRRLPSPD